MAADGRLDWFPCEPGPLLGALAGMPPPKKLVYMIVLLRIYEAGGPCPDSLEALATRTGSNRRIVTEALNELFQEGRLYRGEGGIRNAKADAVIADSLALRQERQRSGAEGGRRASEKRQSDQSHPPSKPSSKIKQASTPVQLQDSLFPNGNRALEKPAKPPKIEKPPTELEIARKELFDRGKQVLGDGAGGFVQRLLAVKHGNVSLARAALEQASTMDNPRQYIGAIIARGGLNGKTEIAVDPNRLGFAGQAALRRHRIAQGPERPAPDDLQPVNRPPHT